VARLGSAVSGAMLLALPATVSCHSWQAADASSGVAPLIAGQPAVRVTRRDHGSVVVESPRIDADSLRGQARGSGQRVAMAVADVQGVEQWRSNGRRTAVVVGLSVAAFVGFNLVFSDSPRR
jgi:hypothetical protein